MALEAGLRGAAGADGQMNAGITVWPAATFAGEFHAWVLS